MKRLSTLIAAILVAACGPANAQPASNLSPAEEFIKTGDRTALAKAIFPNCMQRTFDTASELLLVLDAKIQWRQFYCTCEVRSIANSISRNDMTEMMSEGLASSGFKAAYSRAGELCDQSTQNFIVDRLREPWRGQ